MYIHGRNIANVKIPIRPTRAMNKIVFKTATRCSGKYLCSPFYKGVLLWNTLDANVQKMNTVLQFAQYLKNMYKRYQEIW